MQSADSLIWLLVKDNNSFLHKRARTSRAGGVQFSSEPGNLLSVNSFKYSGLANSKAIDISVDSNKKINLRLKVSFL
jgi:large subunit ribosomal protein L28e